MVHKVKKKFSYKLKWRWIYISFSVLLFSAGAEANGCKVVREGKSTIFSEDCRKQSDGTYLVKICTTGADCVAKETKTARNYRCPDTSPGGPTVCVPYGGRFRPAMVGKTYSPSEAKQATATMNGNTKLMRFSIANDKELSRVLNILSKNAEVSDVLIVAEKEAEPKLVCSLDGKSIAKMVAKESPPSCDSLNIVTFPKVDN